MGRPDEAVDALRDLASGDREDILAAMRADKAAHLTGLLAYPEREAGGFMTTHLVLLHPSDTLAPFATNCGKGDRTGPTSTPSSLWTTTDVFLTTSRWSI